MLQTHKGFKNINIRLFPILLIHFMRTRIREYRTILIHEKKINTPLLQVVKQRKLTS